MGTNFTVWFKGHAIDFENMNFFYLPSFKFRKKWENKAMNSFYTEWKCSIISFSRIHFRWNDEGVGFVSILQILSRYPIV